MNSYRVTYYVGTELKEMVIQAATTGDVFAKLEEVEPDAHNIKIEHIND